MLLRLLAVLLALATAGFAYAPRRAFDVVVVGGTPAGIAAALAAAQSGLNVAFVTSDSVLGGVLTHGMLTQWDLEYDAGGRQLEGGLFAQFYAALPNGFEPAAAARYFARRIRRERRITWFANVRDLKTIVSSDGESATLGGVRFRTDGKPVVAVAPNFIDATETGEIAAAAGARYDVGRQDQGIDLRMQPVTLMFALGGVNWKRVVHGYDAARFGNGRAHDNQASGYGRLFRKRYRSLSAQSLVPDANFQLERDGTVMVNAVDVLDVDGRDAVALQRARRIAVKESVHLVAFLRREVPGMEAARIVRFAPEMYVRETRHIRGMFWIDAQYVWDGSLPYDTVALGSYPLDVHPVTRDANGGDGWASDSHVYGIPLRALIVQGFSNLAVVGAAISATHDASGSLRVLPTTIAEGQAVAVACALSRRTGEDLRAIALHAQLVRRLRQDLAQRGLLGEFSLSLRR